MNTEQRLLQRLRLQLSAIYTLAALLFIATIGALAYGLLSAYFQDTTDLALRSRMAAEFIALREPLPPELRAASQAWLRIERRDHDDDDDEERHEFELEHATSAEAFGGVFLLWLDASGRLRLKPTFLPPGFTPDVNAIRAVSSGQPYDLRTVRLPSGEAVRLLTYAARLDGSTIYLQAGRVLSEQQFILQGLLLGLAVGGSAVGGLAGLISWWLAGRALRPVQTAWARQREFIANASHELRAPLTLIQLSAEVAQREDTPADERHTLLQNITREVSHLDNLIQNLLLLSRADAGKLTLALQPVAVATVFDDVRQAWETRCAAQGVRLEVRPASAVVRADPTYLRQMLIALMDNAVRHTPSGGTITLEAAPEGQRVRLVVRDTGEGIAPEHLPRVFERFYQADTAHSRKGSSGLGLSIVKALVEAMQGEVKLQSAVGRGTEVSLLLPKAAQEKPTLTS